MAKILKIYEKWIVIILIYEKSNFVSNYLRTFNSWKLKFLKSLIKKQFILSNHYIKYQTIEVWKTKKRSKNYLKTCNIPIQLLQPELGMRSTRNSVQSASYNLAAYLEYNRAGSSTLHWQTTKEITKRACLIKKKKMDQE